MTDTVPHQAKADHRIEVARRKRQVMRSRILRATMQVYSLQPISPPSVEDIIKAAGISKGGFYRYFPSTTEALEEISYELADELAALIRPAYDVLKDPLQRACVGTILVLRRAAGDPDWAGFMFRADLSKHHSKFLDFIYNDIRHGAESGQFKVEDVTLATELVMGINQIAILGIASRARADQKQYLQVTVRFLLRSLGVSNSAIDKVLVWSESYFASFVPEERWWDMR